MFFELFFNSLKIMDVKSGKLFKSVKYYLPG